MGSVKVRVSTDGGDKPRWRGDGAGAPVRLFDVHVRRGGFFPYDVAAGGRFLVDAFDTRAGDRPDRMTVVVNWPGAYPRRDEPDCL